MVKNESRFLCCFFDMLNTKPTQGLKRTEFSCMCTSTKSKSDVFFWHFLVFACEFCKWNLHLVWIDGWFLWVTKVCRNSITYFTFSNAYFLFNNVFFVAFFLVQFNDKSSRGKSLALVTTLKLSDHFNVLSSSPYNFLMLGYILWRVDILNQVPHWAGIQGTWTYQLYTAH